MGKKKSKQGVAKATADDFDHMLEELRAADLLVATTTTATTTTTTTTISTATSTTIGSTTCSASGVHIPEETIIQAVKAGDLAQLRRWVRLGVHVSSSGEPLCYAVGCDNVDVARSLIEGLGANVNQAGDKGVTPMLLAAQYGDVAMVHVLKELGADVNQNQADAKGVTPLLWAAQNGDVAMARCLIKDLGADVSKPAHHDYTPLHVAAEKGHADLTRVLVKVLGADVNCTTIEGWTPCHMPALEGNVAIVRTLKELGGNVNQVAKDGRAPLFFAAQEWPCRFGARDGQGTRRRRQPSGS
jgi:ankyrin repeat protein